MIGCFIEALGVDCYQSELVGQARAAAGAPLGMYAAMVTLPVYNELSDYEALARVFG